MGGALQFEFLTLRPDCPENIYIRPGKFVLSTVFALRLARICVYPHRRAETPLQARRKYWLICLHKNLPQRVCDLVAAKGDLSQVFVFCKFGLCVHMYFLLLACHRQ